MNSASDHEARGQSYEPVYRELKRSMMSGDLQPGARLVVSHLSKKFRTSAMPVRQALQRLVAENALTERPHRGVHVPVLDIADLVELRRVRCAIEGQAAEWAAETVTNAELDKLAELQARMLAIRDASHAENYLAWNMDFHFTMYGAARSPLLIPVIESLWLRAGPCLNIMRTETTLGLGLHHHNEVLSALARGDGVAARHIVESELSEAAEIMIRSFGRVIHAPERMAGVSRPTIEKSAVRVRRNEKLPPNETKNSPLLFERISR